MSVIGVYDEKKVVEPKYYFKLDDCGYDVRLMVVTEDGAWFNTICYINKTTGKIRKIGGISDKLGFNLKCGGKVEVV